VKVLKPDSTAPRKILAFSLCQNPETAVRQTACPLRFVCIFTVNPQTFMRSGATHCMGVTVYVYIIDITTFDNMLLRIDGNKAEGGLKTTPVTADNVGFLCRL